jgi:hypothetical protein
MVHQAGCETGNSVPEDAGFPYSFADLAERVKPAVVYMSGSRSKCQDNDFLNKGNKYKRKAGIQ